MEFHTKIPLIHWIPKKLHRKILKFFGFYFLSKEQNLNLLTKNDLINFMKKLKQKKILFFSYQIFTVQIKYNFNWKKNLIIYDLNFDTRIQMFS